MNIGLCMQDAGDQIENNKTKAVEKYESNLKDLARVCVIEGISPENEDQPCCEIKIGDLNILTLLDTSASVSLIKREIVDRLPKSTIACSKAADTSVQDANRKTIVISDIIYVYFELCGRKLFAPFHVLEVESKQHVRILVGINILRSENLIIDLGKKAQAFVWWLFKFIGAK